jgi:hypothetical protein
VQYFRVETSGDFDPVVEVYDACGGNLLACQNAAGPGQRELFWLTGLTVGEDYYYRVYHAGSGSPSTTAFQTGVAHIPVISLWPGSCGATDLVFTDFIRSLQPNPNFLLDGYVFEFTDTETGTVYEVNSPNGTNPNFRMSWFPQVELGKTYSVRTRARMYQGPNLGEYGPSCLITMAGEVVAELRDVYANGNFDMCDIIKSTTVGGATNYRWEFTDLLGGTTLEFNTPTVACALKNVPGLELGTTYSVEIFATVNGQETTNSVPKLISMNNFVPNTQINPSLFSCGSTVPLSTTIQAIEVCAVSQYTFRFTNLSQPELEPIEYANPTRVILLSMVGGLVPGDTYNVAVRANSGGLMGDYSVECELTIFDPMTGLAGDDEITAIAAQEDLLEPTATLNIYPNPSTGSEVMIAADQLKDSEGDVVIEIYDLQGKRILEERFGNSGTSFNRLINLNGNLPAGVYMVRTLVNGEHVSSDKLYIE